MSVPSKELQEAIDRAIRYAHEELWIYSKKEADELVKKGDFKDIIMFNAPAVDETQHGYQRILSSVERHEFYRGSDILVGFLAETDATFDIMVDLGEGTAKQPILKTIPWRMKAGEFRLAWLGRSIFPALRVVYTTLWLQNLRGSVRLIGCHLSDILRREFVQLREYKLCDGWTTVGGILGH